MNVRVLTFFVGSALFAADEERLALVQKAQADYQRVFLAPAPQLANAQACIRSVAGTLTIATPEEAPVFHFEKGWCTLQQAAITHDASLYQQAASEFDQAVAAWPAQFTNPKKRPPEPMPSVFPVMAAVARLNGGADANPAPPAMHICPPSVMTSDRCEAILNLGREWQGYLDLKRNDLDTAARDFPKSPWTDIVAGKQLFRDKSYAPAAAAFRRAIDAWTAQQANRIAPQLNLSDANADLGGAQLLAGDTKTALASLNEAVRLDPANARALFLRARVRDAMAQTDAAIADYNLASRSALAKGGDQSFGESHLYRGIAFYRRKDFVRAEDEFSDALNGDIAESLRADAVAWRRLSAVASGSCEVARRDLDTAVPAASPFFPRDEVKTVEARCTDTALRR